MSLTQDQLTRLANNPVRGINTVVNAVENNWFDRKININSKSHPFVLATDLILGTTHGLLNRIDDGISKLFPVHARNISDLSKHMSDDERVGMFATPSSCTLQFAIEEGTFMSIAKDEVEQMGKSVFSYKTLLLPKDSEITLAGYVFALVNGVRIRYSDKTGYQVVYDDSTNNPFFPIQNNLLKRESVIINNKTYLLVDVPVKQLECQVLENITANEASGCNGLINYKDYLYACRAFLIKDGRMTELKVTYDQDVFDPQTPTLALNIDTTNRRIKYEIPDVYISNRLGLGTVRIYTYTTKGELSKDFTDTDTTSIRANYQDYRFGAGTLGDYSSGIRNVGGTAWRALSVTSGGSNATSFDIIKRNFINGRRQRVTPITENNLMGTVEEYGYSAVKTIDYLTGRSYALTKELPIHDNKKFYSPMNCYVGSHLASANDLIASGMVIDNGKRITIPHNLLFDVTTPTTNMVNDYNTNRYAGFSNDQIVDLINRNTLVYTPFYYVLDMTNDQAVLRTYHLDQPKIRYQNFKAENSSLGYEVGVGFIDIKHEADGYVITLATESGTNYKDLDNDQVGVQLYVNPEDSNSPASLAGSLVGITEEGERIWQFKLTSKFDVDVGNVLYLNNLYQFGNPQPTTGVKLDLDIGFIFTLAGDKENTDTAMDSRIEQELFTTPMIGIIETTYSVSLGKELNKIYSRIRPLVGEGQFKRYTYDVPARYEETVYERDVNGELVIGPDGLVVVHNAGDIIFTPSGQPVLEHKIGDYVFEDGELVELEPKDLKYHWDFIAFDGSYYFTKDVYDLEFAQQTKDFFTNVIDQDMSFFAAVALDRTSLVYQPRNKLGYQKVVINNNFQSYMKQDISFEVIYYLTANGHRNQNLKNNLSLSTPIVINKALFNATTISTDELVGLLKENLPSDVVGVKLGALTGDSTIDVISSVDQLNGFCVRKKLRAGGDGLLTVQEEIDVAFLPHDVGTANIGTT